MEGRQLLKLLLEQKELTANGLAVALKGATKQPQIHKFLTGAAREPRRSTLQPVADYLGVQVEAFYDEDLALQVAIRLGLIEAPEGHKSVPQAMEPAPASKNPAGPVPLPQSPTPSLRDALRRIATVLADESPGVRKSVAALFGDLADHAEDPTLCERTIDRIMGVLGQAPGNSPPASTLSAGVGK